MYDRRCVDDDQEDKGEGDKEATCRRRHGHLWDFGMAAVGASWNRKYPSLAFPNTQARLWRLPSPTTFHFPC